MERIIGSTEVRGYGGARIPQVHPSMACKLFSCPRTPAPPYLRIILFLLFSYLLPLTPHSSIIHAGNLLTDRYNLTSLDLSNGLPHNHVSDIFMDSNGFLWISTYGGGLVRYVFREETKGGSVMPAPAFDDQRIAYIVGSGNPVTVEQVQRLLRKPGVAADAIDLKDAEVSKEWRSLAVTTSRVIKGDPVCAKTVTSNISNREIETELSARAKELYKDGVRKMVVTGGDTANVVLNSLGFSEIEILCESEPGVVLGIGRGENLEPLCVVTKSGGFGTPEAFVKLEKILRNEKGEEHV